MHAAGGIEQLQLERLQATLNRVYKNVTCYRNKFKELGIVPEDVQSLADLSKLPFTTKEDLRLNYPYGMFAVPLQGGGAHTFFFSGTTGKPTVVGYTKHDIKVWSNLVARFMTAAGVTHDDVVQIAFGYGMFTGAFGLHYGSELHRRLRHSHGRGKYRKADHDHAGLQDHRSGVTPSYAITMAERMEKMGVDPKSLSLKVGLFGGGALVGGHAPRDRDQAGHLRHRQLRPLRGHRPRRGRGMRAQVRHAYLRGRLHRRDHRSRYRRGPPSGKRRGTGADLAHQGSLPHGALPDPRHHLARLFAKCDCGRTTVRMKKTMGRTDDMLIIKGVNVYPSQIEDVLFAVEGCQPHYQLVVDRKGALDALEIRIEVTENIFFDEMKMQKAFLEKVEHNIESILGVGVTVKLVEPNSLPRHEGKAVRFIDNRKI